MASLIGASARALRGVSKKKKEDKDKKKSRYDEMVSRYRTRSQEQSKKYKKATKDRKTDGKKLPATHEDTKNPAPYRPRGNWSGKPKKAGEKPKESPKPRKQMSSMARRSKPASGWAGVLAAIAKQKKK